MAIKVVSCEAVGKILVVCIYWFLDLIQWNNADEIDTSSYVCDVCDSHLTWYYLKTNDGGFDWVFHSLSRVYEWFVLIYTCINLNLFYSYSY